MKPVVYFDFKEINNDEVSISKKRLQEILEEVYQAGYSDGSNCKPYITATPYTIKDNITYYDNVTTVGSIGKGVPTIGGEVITCNNSESK